MHFAILDIEERSDEHGNYTSYGISINGGHHSSLRYRQLRELHDQLKKEFGVDRIPAFPPKKLLNLNQVQIDERRELLEKYLQAVSQDPEIVTSRTFVKFLLKSQMENHNVEEEDIKLDVYLMNGKKFQVDVRNTGSTDYVMQEAMSQIKLPANLIKHFALFLVQWEEEDGKIAVIRKLQGFESPFLVLLDYKDAHRLVVRKNFWSPKIEDELFKDTIALNLLFVQAVSDIERDWIVTAPDALKELTSLKKQNDRKKYLKLARTQKFYNYIQCKPCIMDFPEPDSHVVINIGGYELNFRIIGEQKQTGKEGCFKVTRMKCWRVMSSRTHKDEEVVSKIAFQYLFSKDKFEWITISSEQAMLISLCLQSMVNEIVKDKKTKAKVSGSESSKSVPANERPAKSSPVKEQSTKSHPVAEKDSVESQRRNSLPSSGSSDGSHAEKNEQPSPAEKRSSKKGSHAEKNEQPSPAEKRSSKKGKKHQKVASVKNEVFAQDIGDDDL